jgi:hypothetical protein
MFRAAVGFVTQVKTNMIADQDQMDRGGPAGADGLTRSVPRRLPRTPF